MARWANIVTAVKSEGGFDATDAQVRAWVLARAQELNAEAKYLTAPVEVATTVAGQGTYTLAEGTVDVYSLLVDGFPYDLATPSEIERLDAGAAILRGRGGVFAEAFTSDGSPAVEVRPVPGRSGVAVTGRHILAVTEPEEWNTANPPFPADFDRAIINGAIADGLARLDERADLAQWFEAQYQAAIPRLRKRRHGRVGRGPVRIKVVR